MNAAEVLARAHHRILGSSTDARVNPGDVLLDALKAAGYAVIELPTVAHKGPHDTDAMFFRQVADRMETPSRVDFLSGSNVRRAVRALLYRAADAAEAVR